MLLVGPNLETSTVFVIASGRQVTLSAQGLAAGDVVYVEIVTLSSAPEFKGNVCCDIGKINIEVLSAVPLKCPDGSLVTLTADYPFVVLDGPQMVTMRVRVEAALPGAAISVELNETASETGCALCACRTTPCVDTTWGPTGETRCAAGNIENKEESNCGTLRWTVVGPQTWVPTGETRCANHLIENQEVNGCGTLRWTPTTLTCGYCPSLPLSCDGLNSGYGYHIDDPKDPAATVEMAPCAGDTSVDSIWIYPTAGEGHTIKELDCDGTLIGYAANRSDCAAECGC